MSSAKESCSAVFRGQRVVQGSIVTFGQYPQANETPEPVEWIVLDVVPKSENEEGRILLLSKYVLDAMSYHEEDVCTMTWEDCTLREWLNDDFMNEAFSSSEKSQILNTHLENSGNPYTDDDDGNDTDDYVFLLSLADALSKTDELEGSGRYFSSDAERKVETTAHAIDEGVFDIAGEAPSPFWWLRTPSGGDGAAYVDNEGHVVCDGEFSDCCMFGVRPALWVRADSPDVVPSANNGVERLVAAPVVEPPAAVDAAADVDASCGGAVFRGRSVGRGSIVTFGQYPQTFDPPEHIKRLRRLCEQSEIHVTPRPIEWIVLDIVPWTGDAEGRILLLSKYLLDAKPYDTSHKKDSYDNFIYPTWAESDIRKWLNDTSSSGFLSPVYFTAQDQSLIVEVTNETSDYVDEEYNIFIDGGEDTKDKVFLLDSRDADNMAYFKNAPALVAKGTIYAIARGLYIDDKAMKKMDALCTEVPDSSYWWLRSAKSNFGAPMPLASCVSQSGYLTGGTVRSKYGIRPALWVRADEDSVEKGL